MIKFCLPGKARPNHFISIAMMLLILMAANFPSFAQAPIPTTNSKDTFATVDLTDVLRKILKKKEDSLKQARTVAILPTFSYNPSLGLQIGGKLSAQKIFEPQKNTSTSTFGLIAMYTSKKIANFQAIHNIFTPGDKMIFQGNLQFAFFQVTDYGIGPAPGYPDSVDDIKFKYLKFYEKAYVKVAPHFYVGGGVNVNDRFSIKDKNLSHSFKTAHYNYSMENGFDTLKYKANGYIVALQYNTVENPIRSYGGMYADLSFQVNQKWLSSTKNSVQLVYEFRKYWSLSKKNPATILAIWSLASFKLSGTLPYLEMPNTASDPYARSGRGYTISRFKRPSYFYFETEYRFPISRNKLLSGVCFVNTQTASNNLNKELFGTWASAGGAGLRVLFQKLARTTICFDYAIGQYGSRGLFIGLNEAF